MALNSLAVGKTLGEIRKARGLTQREVAAHAGLTVNYLSLLENGQRGASIDVVNKLALSLGVPSEFILFLAGDGKTEGKKKEFRELSEATKTLILGVIRAESTADS